MHLTNGSFLGIGNLSRWLLLSRICWLRLYLICLISYRHFLLLLVLLWLTGLHLLLLFSIQLLVLNLHIYWFIRLHLLLLHHHLVLFINKLPRVAHILSLRNILHTVTASSISPHWLFVEYALLRTRWHFPNLFLVLKVRSPIIIEVFFLEHCLFIE